MKEFIKKFLMILVVIAIGVVQEVLSWERCNVCDGSTRCPRCLGKGVVVFYRPLPDFENGGITFDRDHPLSETCPDCNGSGKCPRCGGRGIVEK